MSIIYSYFTCIYMITSTGEHVFLCWIFRLFCVTFYLFLLYQFWGCEVGFFVIVFRLLFLLGSSKFSYWSFVFHHHKHHSCFFNFISIELKGFIFYDRTDTVELEGRSSLLVCVLVKPELLNDKELYALTFSDINSQKLTHL